MDGHFPVFDSDQLKCELHFCIQLVSKVCIEKSKNPKSLCQAVCLARLHLGYTPTPQLPSYTSREPCKNHGPLFNLKFSDTSRSASPSLVCSAEDSCSAQNLQPFWQSCCDRIDRSSNHGCSSDPSVVRKVDFEIFPEPCLET